MASSSLTGALAARRAARRGSRPRRTRWPKQYGFLAAYLRTQYVITLTSEVEPDGAEHTLEVRVNGVADSQPFTAPDFYPQIAFEGVPEGEIAAPVTNNSNVTAQRGLGAITASTTGAAGLSAGRRGYHRRGGMTITRTVTPGAHP